MTETSGANFLIVENGTIVSPTLRNTLPGISRATVIELAEKLGIPFVERDIQVHSVMNADEAFLASTPYCLCPVTKINGVMIGDGQPGFVYRRLMSAWNELVGLDIAGAVHGEAVIVADASRIRPTRDASATSRNWTSQCPNLFDPGFHHVACFQEFSFRVADA